MDEAALCERIALIEDGRIMSIDSPDNITGQYPFPLYAIRADNMGKLLKDLRIEAFVKSFNSFGSSHHITFQEGEKNGPERLKKKLIELNHENIKIEQITPTIEDCFIHLMKKQA